MSRLYSFAIAHIISSKQFTREPTLIKILRTKQLQISRSNKFDYIIEKKKFFSFPIKNYLRSQPVTRSYWSRGEITAVKTGNANQRASKVVGHDGDRDKELEEALEESKVGEERGSSPR